MEEGLAESNRRLGRGLEYSGKEISSGELHLYRWVRRSEGCKDMEQVKID